MDGSNEIDTILDTYHSATLSKMAEGAGLDISDPSGKKLRKAELISMMRAEFFTEARVRGSWEKLDRREQAVLNRLLLREGKATTKSFRRAIIRAGLATEAKQPEPSERRSYYSYSSIPYADGYAGRPTRRRSTIFEDVIARLTYHGLVFSHGTPQTSGGTPYKLQFHPGANLYVPEVIRRYLPAPEMIQTGQPDWQPARVETGTRELLLRDLYLYWDLVRRNEVSLIQTGFVGKRWLKTINGTLLVPDPLLQNAKREDHTGRLYLLRQMLETLRLAQREGDTLRPAGKDPLHVPEFWSRTPTEQASACLEVWARLDGPGGLEKDADRYNPRYGHARQAVLAALKTLRAGIWIEPEELVECIQERDANFLFPEHTYIENYHSRWYYSYSGSYYAEQREVLVQILEKLEADFVQHCLTGLLFQLEAVELGYDDGTLQAFRIAPDSPALLGPEPPAQPAHRDAASPGAGEPTEDETGKLIVQPNFQLMAIGPVSLAVLARLDLFAEREQAHQGAFQYRLSRDSVYQAQQLGLATPDVIQFLEQASDTDLPQNVRRSLEEWGAQHERIIFRTGVSLLQAADADLMAALMDDPRTGKCLARPVLPDVAIVKKKRQRALISALVEQGLFPAISGAEPEAADDSVTIDQDGIVHPIHAVPSLHLRGRLSRLAEETPGGEWRLTQTSVRRAGGSRGKVLRLLDELSSLHRGPFPTALTEQIKAWGSYYGHAVVETLTLIEFDNPATLDELRKLPELRASLTLFPAGDRALAAVPADKLAQIKETLTHLGVRVKERP